MVVAVAAVGVMQVAIDQVIDVVAMRHRLVAATGAMNVAGLMGTAVVIRRATVRVGRGDLNHVLVDMVAVRMMEMPIVQMIHVTRMAYGGMAAAGAVLMRMTRMMRLGAGGHLASFRVAVLARAPPVVMAWGRTRRGA